MDLEWFYYITKTYFNFTKEEFINSTYNEMSSLWYNHCKYMGYLKEEDNVEKKMMFIDELPL